jgi:hypothetical protein
VLAREVRAEWVAGGMGGMLTETERLNQLAQCFLFSKAILLPFASNCATEYVLRLVCLDATGGSTL